mgnify:CR=1 FL=1
MENSVTLGGTPIVIRGKFPRKGQTAPDFSLVAKDLADVTLEKFAGKRKILNIFPSIDTSTCATSVRKFNQRASEAANTVVLCISADLPFAQSRFCGAEGLENVLTLSTMRGAEFLQNYGVAIGNGPLAGVAARAVVVLALDDYVGAVDAARPRARVDLRLQPDQAEPGWLRFDLAADDLDLTPLAAAPWALSAMGTPARRRRVSITGQSSVSRQT